MAKMVPDICKSKSAAERVVFQRLRRELPESAIVLHSLGLSELRRKVVGEADFVVLSPLGIFVLEVKGGGVSCRDGKWAFTNGAGQSNTKAEGPWAQASTAMFAVRDAVQTHAFGRGLLYGYGVILLDECFTASSTEIVQEVLFDKRHQGTSLSTFIERLSGYWSPKATTARGAPRLPSKGDLESLKQALRPDTQSSWNVGVELDHVEREQARLSDEQARILMRLDQNPRTIVTGAAGTGKTFLALDFARRQAERGAKVLYLCFNRILGQHVSALVTEQKGKFEAASIHAWFSRRIRAAGIDVRIDDTQPDEFYVEQFPELFERAVLAREASIEEYDLIVLDEAQDLLRAPWIDALSLVLRDGFDGGRWALFMDPNQEIYDGLDPEVVKRLTGYGSTRFELTINCRNTLQIAKTAVLLSGLRLPLEGAIDGQDCRLEYFKAPTNDIEALEAEVQWLLKSGVSERDLIILSPRRRQASGLEGKTVAGHSLRDLTSNPSPPRKGEIDFCTMQGFKGMERKAVVAFGMTDLCAAEWSRLFYVGLSRARTFLSLVLPLAEKANVAALIGKNITLTYTQA